MSQDAQLMACRLCGLLSCLLQFFLGILWSLPWRVSISTLYPAQTQSLCSQQRRPLQKLLWCSLVPVASFPGSRWVVPAGTGYSRHTRFLQAVGNVQQMWCMPQEGKKTRKVGTLVLPLFSRGPLFSHLPGLSTGHCADSGTQRQHGSTRKGVSNSVQLFHTSSQFSIAFSLH